MDVGRRGRGSSFDFICSLGVDSRVESGGSSGCLDKED